MKMARVRLNISMTVRGVKLSAGSETLLESWMAGAMAAEGEVTLLDGDNPIAERSRAAVVEARQAVYGPGWHPGACRGVERRAYGADGRLMH